MNEFKVGDKVTHTDHGDGEIKYGPYNTLFEETAYLVAFAGARHSATFAEHLTPRPSFQVGDLVRSGPFLVAIAAGPFQDATDGTVNYVIEDRDGDFVLRAEDLLRQAPKVSKIVDGVAEDTETVDGVTYILGAVYRDCNGDFWEFTRRHDGRVPGHWYDNNGDGGYSWSLAAAVSEFGPLTRVEN